MSIRLNSALFGAVALAVLGTASANAESVTKQCAAKWQAAKAANTTGGLTYLQFYSKCSADMKAQNAGGAAPAAAPAAPAAPAAAPVAPAAAAAPTAPVAPPAAAPAPAAPPKPAVAAPVAPAAAGAASFPTAVDPSFASLKPGDARRKTCSKGYQANKAAGSLGGLKWDQYYSQCNTRLKGGA